MKAAIMHGVHQPLTIEQVEIDEPGDREILVRTSASGVCHSDLHYIEDLMPMQTPAILGHEAAGVVEAVGSKVTYVQPGDHVIACGSAFCGECQECLTGHPNRCVDKPFRTFDDPPRITLNGERVHNSVSNIASFAEWMLLSERGVVKVRDDMPLDVASLVGCGVITGVGAVLNAAQVKPGSTVAVFGVGGVGLSAVQGAYLSGARQVIAVDLLEAKLGMAREFGATHGVNASEGGPRRGRAAAQRRRRRLFLRGDRERQRRAAVRAIARPRRDGDDHRRDPGLGDDRARRTGARGREVDSGNHDGLEQVPRGHAQADRALHAGPPQARRDDHPPR